MMSNADKLAEIANAAANERAQPNYKPFRDNALEYVDFLLSELDRLQSIQQERDKLIDGLKFIRDNTWSERFEDARQDARETLESIGVGEERT